MPRRVYSPFERQVRAAARLALYGSLAVVAAAAWFGSRILQPMMRVHAPWATLDYAAMPEVQLLQEYVRIDTSYPTGSELEGAQFLARQLEAAGIPATIERIGRDQANLWAVLEGEDPSAVVLHQHIDTDPVPDPENWNAPPFGAQINGPWIYGRGVFDMKSVGAAQLLAVVDLKKSGKRLRRSVVLLATGSEERGSDFGMQWILREHPELARRFWTVLTEGGLVEAVSESDVKYWGTEFAQRRQVEVVFCSPRRERLEELRADVREISPETPPRLTPEAAAYFEAYGPTRQLAAFVEDLSNPEAMLRRPGGLDEIPSLLRGAFVSACYAGEVRARPDGGFELTVQCLLLPREGWAESAPVLLPPWVTHGVVSRVRQVGALTPGSPLDHEAWRAIEAELAATFPRAPHGPWLQVHSVTDARFLRPAGIATYGFSPFPVLVTDTFGIGHRDEHMSLEGYLQGVGVYRRLLERLAL